jgi:hypothetical protein
MDLPQSQLAFPAQELKGEAGTGGAVEAIPFFEVADVNFFSTAGTG